jgi:hypothetical protein
LQEENFGKMELWKVGTPQTALPFHMRPLLVMEIIFSHRGHRVHREDFFSNFSHEVTVKHKGIQRKDEDRKIGRWEDRRQTTEDR